LNNTLQSIHQLCQKIDSLFAENEKQSVLLDTIQTYTSELYIRLKQNKKVERQALFEHNCKKYFITNKEKEIIGLIESGYFYKEIALKIFVSRHTVKKHIQNIHEKLQVNNFAQMLHKIYEDTGVSS